VVVGEDWNGRGKEGDAKGRERRCEGKEGGRRGEIPKP
jgi:hypothetical protein